MTKSTLKLVIAAAVFGAGLVGASLAGAAEDGFVAGSTPDQRPAGAPVIEKVEHDKAWYAHALTGVVPPYPPSLNFLDRQGEWYTPFTRPGMPGPYDIRGWHKAKS
ncbi:MAG: hypothetical protein R3D02_03850 [Hyphomicrobiales bacterium]